MRLLRLAARGAALLVGLLAALEIAFRMAGLVVGTTPAPAPDGSMVVLCVGDSHTRGQQDPNNYPAQLERLLNERGGQRYRVINAGIPGENTAQVRSRFERYLAYYRPSVVLHLSGINNARNQSESESWQRGPLGRLVEDSRVARFVRVWRYYRRLRHDALEAPAPELLSWKYADGARWRTKFGGEEEDIHTDPGTGTDLPASQLYGVTRDDLEVMLRTAWGGGVPMYLVTYPLWAGDFETTNRAITDAAAALGLPVVDSSKAVDRLVAQGQKMGDLFDAWVHPTPALYREIAVEAYHLLVAQRIVPDGGAGAE